MCAVLVTDENFEAEVLKSDLPVVVDFWADDCPPCRALGPIFDELSVEMANKVKMVKMNVYNNPHTPGKFNIRGIPTLIAFKNGQAVATKVGGMSKSQLNQWLESVA